MGFFDRFRRRAPAPPPALPAVSFASGPFAARAEILSGIASAFGVEPAALEQAIAKAAGPKTPITDTPGVVGFSHYGGYLAERETNAGMQGQAKWTAFAGYLRNIAIVGAAVRRWMRFAGAPSWKVPPFDDSPEAEEQAAFAEQQLANLATPWRTVVQTAAMAEWNGGAIQVWSARKLPDGRIGLADIVERPMHTIERWELDEGGAVLGVWQRGPADAQLHFIERGRMVWTRDMPLTDSPQGVGLLRQVAEPIRELLALRKMSRVGFEVDLGGIPVLKAPTSFLRELIGRTEGNVTYTEADYTRDMAGIAAFAQNHVKTKETGLILDSRPYPADTTSGTFGSAPMYGFELATAGTASHAPILEAIKSVEWQIAALLNAEGMLLGMGGSGSLAMAESKAGDFYRAIAACLDGITETVHRDVLRPLWALNGWDPETAPRPTYSRNVFTDPAKLAALLQSIAGSGITLTRSRERDVELVNDVFKQAGLPTIEADSEDDLAINPARQALADRLGFGPKPDSTPGVDVAPEDAPDDTADAPPATPAKKGRTR